MGAQEQIARELHEEMQASICVGEWNYPRFGPLGLIDGPADSVVAHACDLPAGRRWLASKEIAGGVMQSDKGGEGEDDRWQAGGRTAYEGHRTPPCRTDTRCWARACTPPEVK